jgi:DNA-binding response OmpR family regulator
MRILLIEDDHDLGKSITDGLCAVGYDVHWEQAGDGGLYLAAEWDWDVVILDRLLPGKDGLEVLRDLRKRKSVPVLMLTALNTLDHRLQGLDSGADDYLGKPFEFSELLARLRALARRAYGLVEKEIRYADLCVRPETGRALRGGGDLLLTPLEFRVLEYLLLRKGKVVSRRRLEDLLASDSGDILPNTLDVHMHRLRTKIGNDIVKTRRGQGYLIPDLDKS